jgi:two-component system phosphate regulon sensor histidine kinase PhoR
MDNNRLLQKIVKNPSPSNLAIIMATAISVVVGVVVFFFSWFYSLKLPVYSLVFIVLLLWFLTYVILLNAVDFFLYRRIKIIYKTITKSKFTKDKAFEKMNLDRDIIKDVEREVAWSLYNENKELDKLKQLEEYRKQFLGNVSHELKTPIFNIQGYIETLIEGGIDNPDINSNYLQKAAKNVERMQNIVDDLEMISRIEDGKLHLDIFAFNLQSFMLEMFEHHALMAEQNDITLRLKKGFNSSFEVFGDKQRLKQVFSNLLSNAIKYNNRGGYVSVGAYDMADKVLIEISDTGIGIPEDSLQRIFERFYRVDKGRSRDRGGTGLGLSIVKHIIEAHNQSIAVRSTTGEGTTFTFTLDRA